MITGFFLSIFTAIISFFVGFLPTVPIPAGVLNAFTSVWAFINAYSFLLPVNTMLEVLGIVMTYYVAILVFDIALWIIHLLRGR